MDFVRQKWSKIQRFKCKSYGSVFVKGDGFRWRHKSRKSIIESLLLATKLSCREVGDFMCISKNTVLAWLKWYTLKLSSYLKDKIQMQCEKLHVDELFLKMRNGFHYIWDSICGDTRFACWFLAEKRTASNAERLIRKV